MTLAFSAVVPREARTTSAATAAAPHPKYSFAARTIKSSCFEFLLAAVYIDLVADGKGHDWFPVGRFGWKYERLASGLESFFENELNKPAGDTAILSSGLFRNLLDRGQLALKNVHDRTSKLWWH
jgi:hypothetical protein